MNEKFNKNAKVEKLTTMLGIAVRLIVIDPFYFHFHYKLLCIKAVHLFDKLSLTCPRVWTIENICIGFYVLKRLLNVRYIFEKVEQCNTQFRRVFRKTKKS